jgi:hypothetical protein
MALKATTENIIKVDKDKDIGRLVFETFEL